MIMFNAVFLITVGTLLFLNNFNILPWSIWANLFPFWPVLIIFAGIDAIFGKSLIGKIIASTINILIFLSIIAKVIGLDLPFINKIPSPPKNKQTPELFFTNNRNQWKIENRYKKDLF